MTEYDASDLRWSAISDLTPRTIITEDGRWFDWVEFEGWVLNVEKTAEIGRYA